MTAQNKATIDGMEDRNQTKRSIASSFSANPIFHRVFDTRYSQLSLASKFFQGNYQKTQIGDSPIYFMTTPDKTENFDVNVNEIIPESNDYDMDSNVTNQSDLEINNEFDFHDEDQENSEMDVTQEQPIFTVVVSEVNENGKDELNGKFQSISNCMYTIYNNRFTNNALLLQGVNQSTESTTVSVLVEFNETDVNPAETIYGADIQPYTSSMNLVSNEIIRTTPTLENVPTPNTIDLLGKTDEKNTMADGIIQASEVSNLQLDNATRERLFVILNRRLFNTFRFQQDEQNTLPPKEEQRNVRSPFDNNYIEHNKTIEVPKSFERTEVKPGENLIKNRGRNEISPLGNLVAQFLMQAIGVNNKYNPYNRNGVASNNIAKENTRQDLLSIWGEGSKGSKEHIFEHDVSGPSTSRRKGRESTSKLDGLRLEDLLNMQIQREANLFDH